MQQIIKPVAGIFTYALGVGLIGLLPALPSTLIIVIIGILSLILTVRTLFSSRGLWPIATILLGASLGLFYGKWLQATALPAECECRPLVIEGKVVSLPIITSKFSRFEFHVTNGEFRKVVRKVRLSWFAAPTMEADQHWRLKVKLRKPHGFASLGTFDFEAWAAREGIQGIGYVISGELLSPPGNMTSLRQWLYNWLESSALPQTKGILKALLVGEKSGITTEQWQRLNATGTTHLVVISGLHIGLMALIGYWLTLLLGRLGALPLQSVPLPRIAACVSLLLSVLYGSLAGFGVPVQRALVMTIVAIVGPLVGMRPSPLTLLVVALAVVLTIDPLAMTGSGFWYSFMAVAALVYGMSGRYGYVSQLKKLLKPQWIVFCVLTPLLFFNDQPVSLFSVLINLFAIPFIGLVIVPLLLISSGFAGISYHISSAGLAIIDQLLRVFFHVLGYFSDFLMILPASSCPTTLTVLLAVTGGFLLISPLPPSLKILSPFFILPWLLPVDNNPEYGQAHVTVLDVGQGLAVLVRTHKHTLVYDTGDAFSETFNAAERVIMPYLRQSGVSILDRIMISHGDKDHSGGLGPLLKRYDCSLISCGTSIPGIKSPISQCTKGQCWKWDGVDFQVLAGGGCWKKSNDRSCVLKVTAGKESMLLTGDISNRVEAQLIASGQPLQSAVLLAPHHGSYSSSSTAFLRAVNPKAVLFSSGYNNKFGHPDKRTVERVLSQGASSWNTALHGSLSVVLGSGSCNVSSYRCNHRKYWWHEGL
ncbi:MAG: DNA internalization-related competence protein ComEC/Rec2 [Candidatus Endonucleobacter bathymodioli]|uniref:DNA internalization-related competence protein ComEC/Rec2 n=1 Tax=Candidatus Endonucleibacter bathymodioli TaxID=539814 RepID=A0AA90SSX1_9GAMM|nr:DNA internalization-related competence protein ComEC/Rec2 [Candidatus Endonucleobacter bathymodioli]